MPERQIARRTRQQVIDRANGCCEYCLSQALYSPDPFSVEHIRPRVLGGSSELANLALSCLGCNLNKGVQISAIDPGTAEVVSVFNPRTQRWIDHFAWNENTEH